MQGDLFSSSSVSGDQYSVGKESGHAFSAQSPRGSFGLDKILIVTFLLVISYVMVFSWGVERGHARAQYEEEVASEKLKSQVKKLEHDLFRAEEESERWARKYKALFSQNTVDAFEDVTSTQNVSSLALPKTVSTQPSGPLYTVQVVTYQSQEQANQQIELLKKKGYDAFVIPSGQFLQVCIGRIPTKAKAAEVKTKIQTDTHMYHDAYIRMVPV